MSPNLQLSPHGPGLFLSKHLPDMGGGPSRRRRHCHKKDAVQGKFDGGSKGSSDSSELPHGGGWSRDGDKRPGAAVLGDIEWNQRTEEEISVLAWGGEAVGGVGLSDPGPTERPIRLTVSEEGSRGPGVMPVSVPRGGIYFSELVLQCVCRRVYVVALSPFF